MVCGGSHHSSAATKKHCWCVSLGHKGFSAEVGSPGKYVPSYLFPESAISALAKVVEYSERLARPESAPVKLHDINREKAKQIIAAAMKQSTQHHNWLSIDQIADRVEFMAAIQKGIVDIDRGDTIPHEEIKKQLATWLTE